MFVRVCICTYSAGVIKSNLPDRSWPEARIKKRLQNSIDVGCLFAFLFIFLFLCVCVYLLALTYISNSHSTCSASKVSFTLREIKEQLITAIGTSAAVPGEL